MKVNWKTVEDIIYDRIKREGSKVIVDLMNAWKEKHGSREYLKRAYIMSLAVWRVRQEMKIQIYHSFNTCGLCIYQGQTGDKFRPELCVGCRLRRSNKVKPCCNEFYSHYYSPSSSAALEVYNRILNEYNIEFAEEIKEENNVGKTQKTEQSLNCIHCIAKLELLLDNQKLKNKLEEIKNIINKKEK